MSIALFVVIYIYIYILCIEACVSVSTYIRTCIHTYKRTYIGARAYEELNERNNLPIHFVRFIDDRYVGVA